MRKLAKLLFPFAGLLAAASAVAAQQPVPIEVVEEWRTYATRFAHAKGEYTATAKARQGNTSSEQVAQVAFAFTPRCKRVEVTETEPGRPRVSKRVICCNPKYAFRLDPGKNGWLVREVVMVGDEPNKGLESLHNQADSWLASIHCLTSVERTRLVDLADDLQWTDPRPGQPPTLVLGKERRLTEGLNTVTYRKLTLKLDPDHNNTLRSISAELLMNKTPGNLDITIDQKTIHGVPVPVRFVRRELYTEPAGGMEVTSDASYQIDPVVDLPDAEFTLSAFGLPEPVGVTWSKPTPNYFWWLVAAGGCVLLALGFRYLARRRAAHVTV